MDGKKRPPSRRLTKLLLEDPASPQNNPNVIRSTSSDPKADRGRKSSKVARSLDPNQSKPSQGRTTRPSKTNPKPSLEGDPVGSLAEKARKRNMSRRGSQPDPKNSLEKPSQNPAKAPSKRGMSEVNDERSKAETKNGKGEVNQSPEPTAPRAPRPKRPLRVKAPAAESLVDRAKRLRKTPPKQEQPKPEVKLEIPWAEQRQTLTKTPRAKRREELLASIQQNFNHFVHRRVVERLYGEAGRFAIQGISRGAELRVVLINVASDRKYTLVVKNREEFSCDCLDFLSRGAKKGKNCQHMRYLFCKILGFEPEFIEGNRIKGPDEFEQRLERLPTPFVPSGRHPKSLPPKPFEKLTEKDQCLLCHFGLLRDDPLKLINCPACRGVTHLECLECFLRNNPERVCLFCGDPYIGLLLK